jgi:hypothetical protein
MKVLFASLIAALSFSVEIAAQKSFPENMGAEQIQKWLKKNLIKDVRDIQDVDFEGCKMLLVLDSTRFLASTNAGGGPVGGSFPNDNASSTLSAGAGTPISDDAPRVKAILDFAGFDRTRIEIQNFNQDDSSLVVLKALSDKTPVEIKSGKTKQTRAAFDFRVKTKNAENFAEAFRQAIEQCKQ